MYLTTDQLLEKYEKHLKKHGLVNEIKNLELLKSSHNGLMEVTLGHVLLNTQYFVAESLEKIINEERPDQLELKLIDFILKMKSISAELAKIEILIMKEAGK